jgi:hypothetical protein
MRKNVWSVVVAVATIVALAVAPAHAATVIDFGTGLLGQGGLVTRLADGSLSGSDIPIGSLTVVGAPANSGTWAVSGGLLDFATGGLAGPSSISIEGAISGLGLGTQTLLSGTISSFAEQWSFYGLITAQGRDTKSPALLTALGLATTTPFEFFGFSLTTNLLLPGSSSAAISTDIKNTAVPEASSLLLISSTLAGLGVLVRRYWGQLPRS